MTGFEPNFSTSCDGDEDSGFSISGQLRSFIFRAILLLCSPYFAIAVDWAPVNPAELQMKDLPEQPGAPAFVLYHEEIGNDHQHYRRRVYADQSADGGWPKVRRCPDSLLPLGHEHTDIHGRTIQPDGSIVEFQGKPFGDLRKFESVIIEDEYANAVLKKLPWIDRNPRSEVVFST